MLTESISYDAQALTDACADNALFDIAEASHNAFSENPPKPIMWTFDVNFEGFASRATPPAPPLGCVKLYVQNEISQTYDLIGHFPTDTCVINGSVSFAPGVAIFVGQTGHVECGIDISGWVEKIDLSGRYSNVGTMLDDFYIELSFNDANEPYHTYDHFTLVATALLNETPVSSTTITVPIASYRPAPNPSFDSAILALEISDKGVFFGTCPVELEHLAYWWYDVHIPIPSPAEYAYQVIPNPTVVPTPAVESCGNASNDSPFQFSMQPGILYIGYDPGTGYKFQGSIDDVLIDPTDSKPPGK